MTDTIIDNPTCKKYGKMMVQNTQNSIQKVSETYFGSKLYKGSSYRYAVNNWKLLGWVTRYSSLKGYPRLVATQLASYYDPKKGYAYPSYTDLEAKLGISKSTVARAVQKIKFSGEWIVLHVPVGRNVREISNRYYPLSPIAGDTRDLVTGEWLPQKTYSDLASYESAIKFAKNNWIR